MFALQTIEMGQNVFLSNGDDSSKLVMQGDETSVN